MFASTVNFRLSLDFFDSGLYTCAAVARLTLALAKLSCYNFLHNDVTMSSLVSTGNCKLVTTADGCVHTDDTTQLSPTSCEFVFTPPTPTRQNSFVASASAVCIGETTLY